jgi:hypothetical protein
VDTNNEISDADKDDNGFLITLGQPFAVPSLVREEGSGYHVTAHEHLILVCMENMRTDEIEELQGHLSLAFAVLNNIFVFQLRPEGTNRCIEMYWDYFPDSEVDPTYQADTHTLIRLVMVEQTTGLVVGIRAFTMSAHMSRELSKALKTRLQSPPSTPHEFETNVSALQNKYRTWRDMLPFILRSTQRGQRTRFIVTWWATKTSIRWLMRTTESKSSGSTKTELSLFPGVIYPNSYLVSIRFRGSLRKSFDSPMGSDCDFELTPQTIS